MVRYHPGSPQSPSLRASKQAVHLHEMRQFSMMESRGQVDRRVPALPHITNDILDQQGTVIKRHERAFEQNQRRQRQRPRGAVQYVFLVALRVDLQKNPVIDI